MSRDVTNCDLSKNAEESADVSKVSYIWVTQTPFFECSHLTSLKWGVIHVFPICRSKVMIRSVRHLISSKIDDVTSKKCWRKQNFDVTIFFWYFLKDLMLVYNRAKFHQFCPNLKDFREGGLNQPPPQYLTAPNSPIRIGLSNSSTKLSATQKSHLSAEKIFNRL